MGLFERIFDINFGRNTSNIGQSTTR